MKIGFSHVDISPAKGLELAGYPHSPRHNTGVHDPLMASCMYIEAKDFNLFFISLDLLFFSRKYADELTEKISNIIGRTSKCFFCCTHTHSGPWAAGRLDYESLLEGRDEDPAYINSLKQKLEALLLDTYQSAFEGEIGISVGYCGKEQGVGGNRRDPNGPSDSQVFVMAARDMDQKVRGCMVKYTLHPTVIHASNTLCTADYPAYLRQEICKSLTEIPVLFMQGASGNQSTRYFREGQTFEEAERIGSTIGAEAVRIIESMQYSSNMDIHVEEEIVPLKLRNFPSKEVAQKAVSDRKAELEAKQSSGASYLDCWNTQLKLFGAEDILGYIKMLEKKQLPRLLTDETPVKISVVRLGDARLVMLQGELFVEFALEIMKASPCKLTCVISLANGAAPGYTYTREALAEGGYENDTSMLHEDTGYDYVAAAIRLLNKFS